MLVLFYRLRCPDASFSTFFFEYIRVIHILKLFGIGKWIKKAIFPMTVENFPAAAVSGERIELRQEGFIEKSRISGNIFMADAAQRFSGVDSRQKKIKDTLLFQIRLIRCEEKIQISSARGTAGRKGQRYYLLCALLCGIQTDPDGIGNPARAVWGVHGRKRRRTRRQRAGKLSGLYQNFPVLCDHINMNIFSHAGCPGSAGKLIQHMPPEGFFIQSEKKLIGAKTTAAARRQEDQMDMGYRFHERFSLRRFSRSPIAIFSLVMGSSVKRRPVALYMASARAGAGVLMTISPMDLAPKGPVGS